MPLALRQEREYSTSADTDVWDVTGDAAEVLAESGAEDGLVTVFVPGSTATVTTIEFESGAVGDLKRAIERLAPRGDEYAHDLRWGDGNGYSHVRAALLGPGLTVPFTEGRLMLGTWQQIVVCDFDNRPRRRRVIFQVMV